MNTESYIRRMNGSMDLWINKEIGSQRINRRTPTNPWEGDWRLAIAEERVATAEAKLAAAERRVRELMAGSEG
jgi:hypothetical protein